MKNTFAGFLLCGLLLLGITTISVGPVVVAQEASKAAAKTTEKAEGAKKAARSGDRLPAGFGKIGISEDQRKKIYELQNKYDDQIAALQKQIVDLRTKEKADVEAVLTADQKKALQAANEESQKKAAEKKKAGEKEKAGDKSEKGEK